MSDSPRPDSKVLEELIRTGEEMLRLPASAFGQRSRLVRLRVEVDHALRRPAPDGRFIDDVAAIMVTVLAHICDAPERRWAVLAEFLLPYLKGDYRGAVEAELIAHGPENGKRR